MSAAEDRSGTPRPVGGLADLAGLAGAPEREDDWIDAALEALREGIPYDVATYWERDGAHLAARRVRGATRSAKLGRARLDLHEHDALSSVLDASDPVLVDRSKGGPDPYAGLLPPRPGRGLLLVPVRTRGANAGLLSLIAPRGEAFRAATVRLAGVHAQLIGLGLLAARRAERLEQYRDTLEERNRILAEETEGDDDACRIVESAVSRPMRRVARMARQVAVTDAPVLITGETGTGKEVLARAIHGWSERSDGPMVAVNCAALPEDLIESELFGHRKGAFSGADRDRPGRFRLADGGTLLLDEIGDLPAPLQVKLLRVLQEGAVDPVGGDGPVPVDVRVIAATHVDLEAAVASGTFREDLFYRLHVFPLHVPPLRERVEDLPVLIDQVLERARRKTGRGPWTVSAKDRKRMTRHAWPGNVRELVNALERARVVAPLGGRLAFDLEVEDRGPGAGRVRGRRPTLDEHQKAYIEEVLRHTGGKVYGEGGAAEILGLPPTTLQSRMKKLGARRPRR